MSNILALLKVQVLSLFGAKPSSKKATAKPMKIGGMSLLLLVLALAIGGIGYIYSSAFLPMLSIMGKEKEIFTYMISMSVLLSFFFSFYSVGSMLYGTKDYDMLSSLPIYKWQIVLAKFIYMSVLDVILSLLLVVPAFIVYAQTFTIEFGLVINVLVMSIFVSGLPIALAVVVGTLFSFLSTRFKRKNLIQTILMFIFLMGIFVLSFFAGEEGSFDVILKLCFVAPLITLGVNNTAYAILTCGVSFAGLILVVVLVTVFYQQINSILLSRRKSSKFSLKYYKSRSEFSTLLRKELGKVFSCPVYALNTLTGSFMAAIIGVVFGILIKSVGVEFGIAYIFLPYIPAVFAFTFMLSPTTCVSISLEGSSFWILKSSPVTMKKLFTAKLAVNMLFCSISSIISVVTFGALASLPFGLIALLLLLALSISSLGGVIGLVTNCRFYRLDYKNDTEAVKRGLSTFLSMLASFFFTALYGVGAYLLSTYVFTGYQYLDSLYMMLIFTGLTLVINAVFYVLLYNKGEKLLQKGE